MPKLRRLIFDDLEIPIPATWADNSVINFLGAPDAGFRPNIVVTRRPLVGKPRMTRFMETQREAVVQADLDEFEILARDIIRIGEREVGRYSYAWNASMPNSDRIVRIRQVQLYILLDRNAVTLTLSCSNEAYETHEKLIEPIVSGISVIKPTA